LKLSNRSNKLVPLTRMPLLKRKLRLWIKPNLWPLMRRIK
jgi:hypothetical protein